MQGSSCYDQAHEVGARRISGHGGWEIFLAKTPEQIANLGALVYPEAGENPSFAEALQDPRLFIACDRNTGKGFLLLSRDQDRGTWPLDEVATETFVPGSPSGDPVWTVRMVFVPVPQTNRRIATYLIDQALFVLDETDASLAWSIGVPRSSGEPLRLSRAGYYLVKSRLARFQDKPPLRVRIA